MNITKDAEWKNSSADNWVLMFIVSNFLWTGIDPANQHSPRASLLLPATS
jgi:hypothetical protein